MIFAKIFERNQPLSNAEVAAVLQVIERADPEWPWAPETSAACASMVGNWILLDNSAAAVASEAVLQGRPREEFADAVVVRSLAELMATFAPGFDAWKGYRDRVTA